MILLLGCSEFALHDPPNVPPVEPEPEDPDAIYGDPPDWSTCTSGWYGQYFNLPDDHPDIEAIPDSADNLDWFDADRRAFARFDASLDNGANWWPVDEGLSGDPAYFSARWTAWLRATDGGTMDVVFGAETIAWLYVNHELVATVGDAGGDLEAELVSVPIRSGQFPVEVRFGQLDPDRSAIRFRVATGDVTLCYPEFGG